MVYIYIGRQTPLFTGSSQKRVESDALRSLNSSLSRSSPRLCPRARDKGVQSPIRKDTTMHSVFASRNGHRSAVVISARDGDDGESSQSKRHAYTEIPFAERTGDDTQRGVTRYRNRFLASLICPPDAYLRRHAEDRLYSFRYDRDKTPRQTGPSIFKIQMHFCSAR